MMIQKRIVAALCAVGLIVSPCAGIAVGPRAEDIVADYFSHRAIPEGGRVVFGKGADLLLAGECANKETSFRGKSFSISSSPIYGIGQDSALVIGIDAGDVNASERGYINVIHSQGKGTKDRVSQLSDYKRGRHVYSFLLPVKESDELVVQVVNAFYNRGTFSIKVNNVVGLLVPHTGVDAQYNIARSEERSAVLSLGSMMLSSAGDSGLYDEMSLSNILVSRGMHNYTQTELSLSSHGVQTDPQEEPLCVNMALEPEPKPELGKLSVRNLSVEPVQEISVRGEPEPVVEPVKTISTFGYIMQNKGRVLLGFTGSILAGVGLYKLGVRLKKQ